MLLTLPAFALFINLQTPIQFYKKLDDACAAKDAGGVGTVYKIKAGANLTDSAVGVKMTCGTPSVHNPPAPPPYTSYDEATEAP